MLLLSDYKFCVYFVSFMMRFIDFSWGKYPNTQQKSGFFTQEGDMAAIGYPDLKEVRLN